MADAHKPNKKAHTDTNLYLKYSKLEAIVLPAQTLRLTSVHAAFFQPQRPRHEDSMIELRRNYGLPRLPRPER